MVLDNVPKDCHSTREFFSGRCSGICAGQPLTGFGTGFPIRRRSGGNPGPHSGRAGQQMASRGFESHDATACQRVRSSLRASSGRGSRRHVHSRFYRYVIYVSSYTYVCRHHCARTHAEKRHARPRGTRWKPREQAFRLRPSPCGIICPVIGPRRSREPPAATTFIVQILAGRKKILSGFLLFSAV